ncbi:MAG: acyl carrier protein [Ruminococcus sp.]|nr:acyl carrier protein [Oscillospiraceae bacterium]
MTTERVIRVIAEHLEVEESTLNENTTFAELGVDSLDAVEIMMELEDEFGIEIKAEEAGKSVKELSDYISAKTEE